MSIGIELDHLVVAAANLEDGVEHVREKLNIDIPPGGRHPFMGTHNHVMQLGSKAFLEIIAIDPNAMIPSHPRWFGLGGFGDQDPHLYMWVTRTNSLDAIKPYLVEKYARTIPMSRPTETGLMEWEITVAADGSLPFDGAFPTVLEWPKGGFPISRMPDLRCELETFTVAHPDIDLIQDRLRPIFNDSHVEFKFATRKQLIAVINTPDGLKTLT